MYWNCIVDEMWFTFTYLIVWFKCQLETQDCDNYKNTTYIFVDEYHIIIQIYKTFNVLMKKMVEDDQWN